MGNAPKILLIDDQTKEQTDLTDIFNKEVLDHSESQHFKIKDETFHITHVQVATTQDTVHRLNFCAHKRTVKPENLVSKIPNLTPSLRDASKDRSFVYCGYVSSPYLDETAVHATREGREGRTDRAVCPPQRAAVPAPPEASPPGARYDPAELA
jgi:hypothetical protein